VPTPINCDNIEKYVSNTFPSCNATTPAYTPFKQCLVGFTGSLVRENCTAPAAAAAETPATTEPTAAPTTAGTAAASGGARSLYAATATTAVQRVHRAVQAPPQQQQQQLSAVERAQKAIEAQCGTELKACYKDTGCAACAAKALANKPSNSDLASCDALKSWVNEWSAGGSCDVHSGALGNVVSCGSKAYTAESGTQCTI
jgi:hypothetical protein